MTSPGCVNQAVLGLCTDVRCRRARNASSPPDVIAASAARYKIRTAWRKADLGAYQGAVQRGILDEKYSPMPKPLHELAPEVLKASAAQCESRAAPSAYGKARRSGWLDMCCTLTRARPGRPQRWTRETVAASGQDFERRSDWQRAVGGAYKARKRWGSSSSEVLAEDWSIRSRAVCYPLVSAL